MTTRMLRVTLILIMIRRLLALWQVKIYNFLYKSSAKFKEKGNRRKRTFLFSFISAKYGTSFVNRIWSGKFILAKRLIFLFFSIGVNQYWGWSEQRNQLLRACEGLDHKDFGFHIRRWNKTNFFLLYINVNMPSNFIDYFLLFSFCRVRPSSGVWLIIDRLQFAFWLS